ncbi:phosphoglycerate mutase-like protein [Aspergillus heteromorphus CBS 117.55]|uniref:Phosphoglycerate mutase-like protein n=1 Tax=Aspergillus heteromorphus CBS 117.55 TaxID=1448321 RepID=A0A317X1R8_9EURO|nr:phosphoglycerate mutase-like protein [Aspergillus heteromorphus CBS 117.55]PWY90918.1 phosphoglycerate mutase-like protein [Aspergillus heteromorphus CBS 117.55]
MPPSTPPESHWQFSIVPGLFQQSDPSTDASTFDYASSNFGLIPRAYPTDSDSHSDSGLPTSSTATTTTTATSSNWERFAHHIHSLNATSDPDTCYKVLFLGRHGEGYHNVAERKYGTKLWDAHYSLLPSDPTSNDIWHDAHLTALGKSQALTAHATWKAQLAHRIPTPESFYVSPLNRCLETASLTFSGLGVEGTRPFRPVVKELLRETIGLHTCDSRSSKSAIAAEYPAYIIEEGFAEEDELYSATLRESNSARDKRFRDLLQDVFEHDAKVFLSLTAHSGAITSLLNVLGHRRFDLETGGVIPVVVRGKRVEGPLGEMRVEGWFGVPSL